MLGTTTKSTRGLERSVERYEAKLAKAANSTQRSYAATMLNMARTALAKTRDGDPVVERPGTDIVDLHADEYRSR